MPDEFQEALDKIFAADLELYDARGFARRIGMVESSADQYRLGKCVDARRACVYLRRYGRDYSGVQKLLDAARQKAFRSSIQRPPIRIRKARTRIWVSGRRKSRSRS